MDGFIEDLYDSKQILLKSMIAEVGGENIQKVWKITDMRSENKKHPIKKTKNDSWPKKGNQSRDKLSFSQSNAKRESKISYWK